MRIGTHHFVDFRAAVEYYAQYGFYPEDVYRKLNEGEIDIGPPETEKGERWGTDEDGRYYIERSR